MRQPSLSPGEMIDWLSQQINAILTRGGGLILALAVAGIVVLLIVPLQPGTMDILLGISISVGVLVLLVSLYVVNTSRLLSFPTILLLTTLFRLALNVSTTKLILGQADAGEIIEAFGQFVVQGNYVVGAVVFLILTLIQFLVIAKGSERVAEVSARFTLDAMTGKQMSIDADLRNNLIKPEEATRRRLELDSESKFYGAMDGAMKFVKGDAIAGIVISAVNVIGGLCIGVLQQGMPVREAAEIYTLLTIGDGLVSQIPALLVCTAAGIMVTRVASSGQTKASPLGGEVFSQFLSYPSAIAVVALLLAGLGAYPGSGLPTGVFLTLACVAAVISVPRLPWIRSRVLKVPPLHEHTAPVLVDPAKPADRGKTGAAAQSALAFFPEPIKLKINPFFKAMFLPADAEHRQALRGNLARGLMHVQAEMGVIYPSPEMVEIDPRLEPDAYAIHVYECPVARGRVAADEYWVFQAARDVQILGLDAEDRMPPWGYGQVCAIPEAQLALAKGQLNWTILHPRDVVYKHLLHVMRRHSAEFVGIQEAQFLLDELEPKLPNLKQEVIPKALSLQQFATVLQRLLREQVPIRNLRLILETLARWAPTVKDPLELAELVRRDMARFLWHHYTSGTSQMQVYTLHDELEKAIERSRQIGPSGPVVSMRKEERDAFVQSYARAVAKGRSSNHITGHPPVILTNFLIRPFVRSMLEIEFPEAPVLSHEELPREPGLLVRAIGQLNFAPPPH